MGHRIGYPGGILRTGVAAVPQRAGEHGDARADCDRVGGVSAVILQRGPGKAAGR